MYEFLAEYAVCREIVMKTGRLRITALRALRSLASLREIFNKCFKKNAFKIDFPAEAFPHDGVSQRFRFLTLPLCRYPAPGQSESGL